MILLLVFCFWYTCNCSRLATSDSTKWFIDFSALCLCYYVPLSDGTRIYEWITLCRFSANSKRDNFGSLSSHHYRAGAFLFRENPLASSCFQQPIIKRDRWCVLRYSMWLKFCRLDNVVLFIGEYALACAKINHISWAVSYHSNFTTMKQYLEIFWFLKLWERSFYLSDAHSNQYWLRYFLNV